MIKHTVNLLLENLEKIGNALSNVGLNFDMFEINVIDYICNNNMKIYELHNSDINLNVNAVINLVNGELMIIIFKDDVISTDGVKIYIGELIEEQDGEIVFNDELIHNIKYYDNGNGSSTIMVS